MDIFNNLGFVPDKTALEARLKIDEDLQDDFDDVFAECEKIANPIFALKECEVSFDGEITVIDSERFESKLMRDNFKNSCKCWVYIMSCGKELYDLALSKDDPLEKYWVEAFAEQALAYASKLTHAKALEISGEKNLYSMNPGSLSDFPITNQRGLFRLMGDTEKLLGVRLTESCLMLPNKSGSGIYFASEEKFVNCALCPRENCPNRRAPFDEMLRSAKLDK